MRVIYALFADPVINPIRAHFFHPLYLFEFSVILFHVTICFKYPVLAIMSIMEFANR